MSTTSHKDRPIKVCFPFVGNSVGGSHISALMLASNLDRDVAKPVVVLHEEGPLAAYVREQGLDYELIRIRDYFKPPYWTPRNIIALAANTLRLAAFLRKTKVDVVHNNDVRIHFGWTLAVRLAGAPLIWHQRTGTFGRKRTKLAFALLSRTVVCITKYTESTLPRRLDPLIKVVANPFDTDYAELDRQAAKARTLARLKLEEGTTLIGFFGNLSQQKRPEVFVEAAARLREKSKGPIAFLVFGAERGDAIAELTRLARRLGIESRVHFMGFQAPIEPWMAGCDLTMAPGVGDGLGRSLVEAMICGTPVVAADSGGHREIISDGQTGRLVTADDPGAFAEAMEALLRDPARARDMADRAQREALERYSVRTHVSEMMAIYREALGLPAKGDSGAVDADYRRHSRQDAL